MNLEWLDSLSTKLRVVLEMKKLNFQVNTSISLCTMNRIDVNPSMSWTLWEILMI